MENRKVFPQFIIAVTQWGEIPYTGRSRLVCATTMSTFYPEPPGEDWTVSRCHLATCGRLAEAADLMPMLLSSAWKPWKHLRGCV